MNSRTQALIRRLSNTTIWNRDVAFYSAAVASALSFVIDCMRLDDYSPDWIWIDALAYVAGLAVVLVFKQAAHESGREQQRTPTANVLVAILVGGLHNCLIAVLALARGLEESVDYGYRFIGGAATLLATLVLTVVITSYRAEGEATYRELVATNQRLLAYQQSLNTAVDAESEHLKVETRRVLLPQISSIRQSLGSLVASPLVLDDLQRLVDNELRPLHNSLAQRADFEQLHQSFEHAGSAGSAEVQTRFSMRALFRPIGFGLALMVQQINTGYISTGLKSLLYGPVTSLPALVTAIVIRQLMPRSWQVNKKRTFWIAAMLGAVCVAPTLVVDLALYPGRNQAAPIIFSAVIVATVFSGYLGYAAFSSLEQQQLIEALADTNQKLEEQISIFDQKIWLARRQWLMVLHGSVQASLTAAITRLKSSPKASKAELEAAMDDLARAQSQLTNPAPQALDLIAAFADLQRTWRGLCEIVPQQTAEAQELILGSEAAKACVNELLKEAVGNAIRHGGASQVWIIVKVVRPNVVSLRVENNGKPIEANAPTSVGSQMFEDLTLEWHRGFDHESGRTFVECLLAV